MVPDDFRDFFVAAAGASGALVGLLFVAISVKPDRVIGAAAQTIHQVRASTALTAPANPLVLALVALIPTANPGCGRSG
jgi:hypothetical protein